MTTEVYFSIDIEADGPIPGPYSMSSLGAVAFGHRSDQHKKALSLVSADLDDELNQFYAELAPISEDFIPEAAAVSGLDRDALIRDGLDAVTAMEEFVLWVEETTTRIGGERARPIFVAWPLSFDWLWVYWYLINFAGRSPFGHSGAMDAKTLFGEKAGLLMRTVGKRVIPKHLKSTRRHTHNALDDALEQADLFTNVMNWEGNKN